MMPMSNAVRHFIVLFHALVVRDPIFVLAGFTPSGVNKDVLDDIWLEYFTTVDPSELMELYGCHSVNDSTIPTTKTWNLFEDAYYSALSVQPPSRKKEGEDSLRGMNIPFEIRYDSLKGRGVFTTEFVPKGTRVWSSDFTAEFQGIQTSNGDVEHPSFRKFIEYLHDKSMGDTNWACDALAWTFIVDNNHDNDDLCGVANDYSLCVSLDHGSLFNDAMGKLQDESIHFQIETEKNEGFQKLLFGVERYQQSERGTFHKSMCHRVFMEATRDIQPSEELLYHYLSVNMCARDYDPTISIEAVYRDHFDGGSTDDDDIGSYDSFHSENGDASNNEL